jgi:cell wall-associated NlpC family hydrolase
VLALCCFAAIPGPASAATATDGWARSAIALVTSRGIFPGTPATFRPTDPLTRSELAGLLSALGTPDVGAPAARQATVSVADLDSALVGALGLRPVAAQFADVARSAGLDPPSRFGTEVVARLLGLRTDLAPGSQELQPAQPATRAEAAFSTARVLTLGGAPSAHRSPIAAADVGGGVSYVQGLSGGFAIPPLSPVQQEILRTAFSLIGFPYVWGGDNEKVEPGFDCSGYVWRVFKLASYRDARGLAGTLRGRTAAQMALEVPRSERIPLAGLQPADILFFRPTPTAPASQIDHTAIYLGDGWLVESAGQGVSLGRLDWYGKRFAWARRPLAEIGLEAWPQPANAV